MRYAALRTLIAISLGILLSQTSIIPWYLPIIMAIIGFFLLRWSKGWSLYLLLICAMFVYTRSRKSIDNYPNRCQPSNFVGLIIEEPWQNNQAVVKLQPPLTGKLLIYLCDSTPKLSYGDLVLVRRKIKTFSFPRNPGILDYNYYLIKQGFVGFATVKAEEIKLIKRGQGNFILTRLVLPVRRYLLTTIHKYLNPLEAKLLIGFLLGEKSNLPDDLKEALTDTGLWHILTVSGLHVGIVVSTIFLLLSVLNIRGWWRLGILASATLFYVTLAAWNAPGVRAAFMALMVFLSVPLQRRTTPLVNLCVAGIIILLLNPYAIFDIGTQLSFLATAAIITIFPKLNSISVSWQIPGFVRNYLINPAFVSISATIGTMPILLHYFYRAQPLSFLSSLLAVPLVTLTIPLALFTSMINALSPFVAAIFAQTLQTLLSLLFNLIVNLGKLLKPFMFVSGRINWLTVFYLYSLVLFSLNLRSNWTKSAFRTILVLGLTIFIWHRNLTKRDFCLTFLDTERGDAVLIEDTLGRKLLIDTGLGINDVLSNYLFSRGITNIDALIITHPDRDHYGGLIDIKNRFKINHLIIPTTKGESLYCHLINELKASGTKINLAESGCRLTGFGANIEFTAPDRLTRHLYSQGLVNTNQVSLVTLIEYQNQKMLFTGDYESKDVIEKVGKNNRLLILKSPHHGSKKGNPATLFDSIKPAYVIVMGRYPTPAKLESILPLKGIDYINTRNQGGVIIRLYRNGNVKFKYTTSSQKPNLNPKDALLASPNRP